MQLEKFEFVFQSAWWCVSQCPMPLGPYPLKTNLTARKTGATWQTWGGTHSSSSYRTWRLWLSLLGVMARCSWQFGATSSFKKTVRATQFHSRFLEPFQALSFRKTLFFFQCKMVKETPKFCWLADVVSLWWSLWSLSAFPWFGDQFMLTTFSTGVFTSFQTWEVVQNWQPFFFTQGKCCAKCAHSGWGVPGSGLPHSHVRQQHHQPHHLRLCRQTFQKPSEVHAVKARSQQSTSSLASQNCSWKLTLIGTKCEAKPHRRPYKTLDN